MGLIQTAGPVVKVAASSPQTGERNHLVPAGEDVSARGVQDPLRVENAKLGATAVTALAACHEMGRLLVAMTDFFDSMVGDCGPEGRRFLDRARAQAARLGDVSKKLAVQTAQKTGSHAALMHEDGDGGGFKIPDHARTASAGRRSIRKRGNCFGL